MGSIILIFWLVLFLASMYRVVCNMDKEANERAELLQYESSKQDIIDNIIEKHKNTLFRKYKQTHYIDEYGKEINNGWDREIKYFIEHVVKDDIRLSSENEEWEVMSKINFCMMDMKYNTNYEPEYEENKIKTGIDYENYIEKILLKDSFVVNRTPTTGDQGVDLIASKNGKRIAIQCKYYSKPVGNKAVQEVIAGKDYYECEYACVVSNNSYTPAAKKLAFTSDIMLLNEDNIVEELNKILGNTDFSSCDDTDEEESEGFKAEELFFTDLTDKDDPLKM